MLTTCLTFCTWYLLSRCFLPMTVLFLTDVNVLGTTLPVLNTIILITPKLAFLPFLLLLPLAIR